MRDMDIARLLHEVNRAFCIATGDHSQKPWDEAHEWQRTATLEGMRAGDLTAEQRHDNWCQTKYDAGWIWGKEKSAEDKTHPCLVPYERLPRDQQIKDYLFDAVLKTCRGIS